jgi:hypothetical protein
MEMVHVEMSRLSLFVGLGGGVKHNVFLLAA